jgi:hypothetical protein
VKSLERRAAKRLSTVPAETVIDRTQAVRLAYALAVLVVGDGVFQAFERCIHVGNGIATLIDGERHPSDVRTFQRRVASLCTSDEFIDRGDIVAADGGRNEGKGAHISILP